MITLENMTKDEIIDLLNRSWMTHDGMWFYHCFQECGIETANRINKAAIRSLAPMEMARMKKALGITWNKIETFDEFKNFFTRAAKLCIPPFMNGTMDTSHENVLQWEFAPQNCFAYKGMKRIGVIDNYECGVIYRLACWFDALGLAYRATPEITTCQMLSGDTCGGDFVFNFGQAVASLSISSFPHWNGWPLCVHKSRTGASRLCDTKDSAARSETTIQAAILTSTQH